jgi:hypothetical protein
MSESKTSIRRLKGHEKKLEALQLRKSGESFASIAKKLGYASSAGSYKAVMTALIDTLQEPADELRDLELQRLDEMQLGLWPLAENGNLGAVDKVLKIMERRAKLLGLDAPQKIAPTTPDGENPYMSMEAGELLEIARKIANGSNTDN